MSIVTGQDCGAIASIIAKHNPSNELIEELGAYLATRNRGFDSHLWKTNCRTIEGEATDIGPAMPALIAYA